MPRHTRAEDVGNGKKAKPFDSADGWLRSLADEIGSRPWIYNVGRPQELLDWTDEQNRLYRERVKLRRELEKERERQAREERQRQAKRKRNKTRRR